MPVTDFVIAPENKAQFQLGPYTKRIWESTRNHPGHPSSWQFRYDPIFVPEVSESGELNLIKRKIVSGWRVFLTIYLDDTKAQDLAYSSLKEVYKDNPINKQNVSALYISSVRIAIPELTRIKAATLAEDLIEFASPSHDFTIVIDVPDEQTADLVAELLPVSTIRYTMTFTAKVAQQNTIKIKYIDLKQSSLYAKLSGLSRQGEAYVHRDDLRMLMEGVHSSVELVGTLEAPDKFDQALADRVLTGMTTKANTDEANFDAQKWASTYHADDLRPDVITRVLNKMVKKDQTKDEWKLDVSIGSDTKLKALQIAEGEIGLKGGIKGEALQELLREREIETQIEGNQIVAKSVNVQRVNLNNFESAAEFTSVIAFISNFRDPVNGHIPLGRIDGLGTENIQVRVKTLEAKAGYLEDELNKLSRGERKFSPLLDVDGDIRIKPEKTLVSHGRMHIAGDEHLFLLNKTGVTVGRGWGGNGNLTVEGQINGQMAIMTSSDRRYQLVLQDDSNVVLYEVATGKALWDSVSGNLRRPNFNK